jgi:hypothetical protein
VVITAIGTNYVLEPDKLFCQYWFEAESRPVVVKASQVMSTWRLRKLAEHVLKFRLSPTPFSLLQEKFTKFDKPNVPLLIYCPFNFNNTLPHSVSITLNPCDQAKNVMTIIDNQPPNGIKKKFVVCSKALVLTNGNDTMKFIEWVETLRILGAEQLYIYHRYLHPSLFQAAQYYEKTA